MQERGVVDEFWSDLRALWEKAERPKLASLEQLGRDQRPSVEISGKTINGWLTGDAVPSERYSKFFAVLVTFLLSRTGEMHVGRSVDVWMQRLRKAQKEQKDNQGKSAPKPDPALRGASAKNLFAAGSGVGSKIIMLPLPGSPWDPQRLITEFTKSLRALGLGADDVAPFLRVARGLPNVDSPESARDLVDIYISAMRSIDDLAREGCSENQFKWFTLGQMLFTVAYQGTYAGLAEGGDRGIDDSRDTLYHICDVLELPNGLRRDLKKFSRMPADTAMDGGLVEEARRLARIITAIF